VLVDLAGSERLKQTRHDGREALREAGAINRSLFTLGQVLAALSSGGGAAFAPYRDSRLTQLLWEGLRGSGRTLMLACLAPLAAHSEESCNTLHYAAMARRIKSTPLALLEPQVGAGAQGRGEGRHRGLARAEQAADVEVAAKVPATGVEGLPER
jgi:hypothetical protein